MIEQHDLDKFRDKVKAVARELGLECKDLNIKYSTHGFTFTGKVYEGEAGYSEEFTRVASRKGFPANWYNQVFTYKGEAYKIVSANMRARKYPISTILLETGKPFNFPISLVREGNPLPLVQSQKALT